MTNRTRHREWPPRLQALIEELRRHAPEWAARLAGAGSERECTEIAARLFELSQHLKDPTNDPDSTSGDLADHIRWFLANHLHCGPRLKQLAQYLGYSEKYCSELFKARMGMPFSRYLAQIRVEQGTRLLAESTMSVAEIAQRLGFSDQFAFSHFFKKAVGCAPRQFREGVRSRLRGSGPLPRASRGT